MKRETDIRHWKEMYDSVTNPKKIADNRRKYLKTKRLEEKKKDYGLG